MGDKALTFFVRRRRPRAFVHLFCLFDLISFVGLFVLTKVSWLLSILAYRDISGLVVECRLMSEGSISIFINLTIIIFQNFFENYS